MKNTLKVLAAILALVLAICVFASCGKKNETPASENVPASGNEPEQTEPANEEVKGAMDEHGVYKVFVPEGYTLKHEDVFGDNNPKSFNINSDSSSLTYFMFNMYSEDNAKSGVATTKELNDGASDVTLDVDGKTWTGVAYDSVGIPCFQLYAEFDGEFVMVNSAGNAYDSEIVKTVLGSLEVNAAD